MTAHAETRNRSIQVSLPDETDIPKAVANVHSEISLASIFHHGKQRRLKDIMEIIYAESAELALRLKTLT